MDDDKITQGARDGTAQGGQARRTPIRTRSRRCSTLIKLYDAEAAAKKAAKEAQADARHSPRSRSTATSPRPTSRALVLDDKWQATIAGSRRRRGQLALTLDLVARIQQLGERYAETVGDLDAELEKLEAKVAGHLAAMGVE